MNKIVLTFGLLAAVVGMRNASADMAVACTECTKMSASIELVQQLIAKQSSESTGCMSKNLNRFHCAREDLYKNIRDNLSTSLKEAGCYFVQISDAD